MKATRISGAIAGVGTLLLLLALAACGGGSGGSGGTPLPPASPAPPPEPPPEPPPQGVNVNIDDPTLVVANNAPIAPGATLALVWSDEFEADQLDPERWFFETGDGSQYGIPGWGNNELQWYLPDSALLEDGKLVITARRESVSGKQFTSARINTRDRFAFQHGRIEASIRLPAGQGLWPAFWLLPQASAYGTWAASGEIDIMEARNLGGTHGNTIYGGLYYGGPWPDQVGSGEDYVPATNVTTGFHVYALEWDESEIRWYVDDTLFAVRNNWFSTGGEFPAPFDQPFYILFNLAVGGNYPGSPTSATAFPVTMEVDYVRVYSAAP
jgi:beta-glucanase (GH16 family)